MEYISQVLVQPQCIQIPRQIQIHLRFKVSHPSAVRALPLSVCLPRELARKVIIIAWT